MKIDKKIKLTLCGLDGNAYSLMGAFSNRARWEGWTKEEIKVVMDECMSGNYTHLLATLMDHCEDEPGEDNDYDENEDED